MTNKKKQLEESIDLEVIANSMFSKLYDDEQFKICKDLILECMKENLNHARHVENERLTFSTVYIAFLVGCFAVMGKLDTVKIYFLLFILIVTILTLLLTIRWNNAFDRHLFYAKQCYVLFSKNLCSGGIISINKADLRNKKEYIEDLHGFPMYCFFIRNPITTCKALKVLYSIRTKYLYVGFYALILLTFFIYIIKLILF